MMQTLWKTVWQVLKKLNIELPYHSAILSQGIYPRELKTGFYKGIREPTFTTA